MRILDYLNTKVLVSQDPLDGGIIYYIMDSDGIRKVGQATKMNKYTHIQNAPLKVWSIIHPLVTTNLIVQVFSYVDGVDTQIYGEIAIISPTEITITFDENVAGRAVLLGG